VLNMDEDSEDEDDIVMAPLPKRAKPAELDEDEVDEEDEVQGDYSSRVTTPVRWHHRLSCTPSLTGGLFP